jgi:hypothetical protein
VGSDVVLGGLMLKYIGNGASVPHIPARDLRDDEVIMLGGAAGLVATGLYVDVKIDESKPVRRIKPTAEPSTNEDGEQWQKE